MGEPPWQFVAGGYYDQPAKLTKAMACISAERARRRKLDRGG